VRSADWKPLQLRRLADCWDHLRIPMNAEERHHRQGEVPYWGANTIQGYVDTALVNEEVVLIGEDGAPFFDRDRPVAFHITEPIWPNNHIHILKPRANVYGRWLAYALNDVDYSLYVGGSTRDKLTQGALMRIVLHVPSTNQQKAITDYLDRETAKIDTLIEEQHRLIEMLHERRQVTVDRLVWSGLEDLPQGPTGIDPVPESPAHWRRLRNKNILNESQSVSAHGDEELLSVSHITGVTPRSEKNVTMIEAESLEGYRLVEPGDLVINTMWAWMGALGVSRHHGVVSPAYGVYRPHAGAEFHPAYFNYLYRSRPYVVEITRHSRGIWTSRLRIYPEVFLRLPIVVPPLHEQRAIANHLDEQTGKIDELIAETERFIELSKERRAALITAAVTGQIDVCDRVREGAA
jgi:type I restriction enzyme, S subunit